ncbi:hypothetical protein D9756_010445 [Leucocoprinus leucothites]|uniref:Zn(2)-C6 fungal-type domain-containing protein n=1 Tax=Leucocoprinus leucothites TaxID=201217 RepID=A0A8H5CNX4_9AGAR|nr:hypothetical protein D9756_011550 [Leucoagaricus leucothites]KAF5348275.1 hypothetical protein D9756_010445 [Leucoagaricus leucothites]
MASNSQTQRSEPASDIDFEEALAMLDAEDARERAEEEERRKREAEEVARKRRVEEEREKKREKLRKMKEVKEAEKKRAEEEERKRKEEEDERLRKELEAAAALEAREREREREKGKGKGKEKTGESVPVKRKADAEAGPATKKTKRNAPTMGTREPPPPRAAAANVGKGIDRGPTPGPSRVSTSDGGSYAPDRDSDVEIEDTPKKKRGNYDEKGRKVKMGGKNECGRCRRLGKDCKMQSGDNKFMCEACNSSKQRCTFPSEADKAPHEQTYDLIVETRATRTVMMELVAEVKELRAEIGSRQDRALRSARRGNAQRHELVEEFKAFFERCMFDGHLMSDAKFEEEKKKEKEEWLKAQAASKKSGEGTTSGAAESGSGGSKADEGPEEDEGDEEEDEGESGKE